jgi:hypothetical protein
MNIKKIRKDYYEQLYVYKLGNQDEMDKLENHNLSKLMQKK